MDSRRSPEKTQDGDEYLQGSRSRWEPGRPPLLGRSSSGTFRPQRSSITVISSTINEEVLTSPPRTPMYNSNRFSSSAFNSPSQGFRSDDEFLILEVGSRFFRAGLGGEASPRCCLDFGPSTQSRAGDYSAWMPEAPHVPNAESYEQWGLERELWRMDIGQQSLDLIGDKLERALRTAMSEHVLVQDDSRKRSFTLVVPPALPHPLLTTLLTVLFSHCPPPPSISLVSSPLLSAVSAGVRSALVVDIGWNETTITPIIEYRELATHRSYRASRLLSWHTAQSLSKRTTPQGAPIGFDDAEEVVQRCSFASIMNQSGYPAPVTDTEKICLPSSGVEIEMPMQEFAEPVEAAFFAPSNPLAEDDESLPTFIYSTLLNLQPDQRSELMRKIVFVGGGSSIPGLKQRTLQEMHALIHSRGWDPISNYGSASAAVLDPTLRPVRHHPARATVASRVPVTSKSTAQKQAGDELQNKDMDPDSTTPPHLQPQLPDPVLANLSNRSRILRVDANETSKAVSETNTPQNEIELRAVKSLGPWAGASLLTGLRIRAVVELEREKFLTHGLAGYALAVADDERTANDQRRKSALVGARNRNSLHGRSVVPPAGLGAWA